jgi:hypothetical protein
MEKYRNHVTTAFKNAKNADPNPRDRRPMNVGTHVYKVVSAINKLT